MPVRPVASTSWPAPPRLTARWSYRMVTVWLGAFLLPLIGSGPVDQPVASAFALSPLGRTFGGAAWPSFAETAGGVWALGASSHSRGGFDPLAFPPGATPLFGTVCVPEQSMYASTMNSLPGSPPPPKLTRTSRPPFSVAALVPFRTNPLAVTTWNRLGSP